MEPHTVYKVKNILSIDELSFRRSKIHSDAF